MEHVDLLRQAAPLSDPDGGSCINTAVLWIEHALLGSVAVAIAILAVASIGFMMLAGRLDLRRGISVVIGCFILFGAPGIARGILGSDVGGEEILSPANTNRLSDDRDSAPEISLPFDPYAGASVPQR